MTLEGNSALLPAYVNRRPPLLLPLHLFLFLRYNKSLNDWFLGKQFILFPSGPVIKCLLLTVLWKGNASSLKNQEILGRLSPVFKNKVTEHALLNDHWKGGDISTSRFIRVFRERFRRVGRNSYLYSNALGRKALSKDA